MSRGLYPQKRKRAISFRLSPLQFSRCHAILIKDETKKGLNTMKNPEIKALADIAEKKLAGQFEKIDKICEKNTEKVLDAFHALRVSEAMLHGTTGYGYDDRGRDVLDEIYARVFGCEDALVRHNFVSGTHVLATALYGILRPGDTLLSVSGDPYDTLMETIGVSGTAGNGSLKDFGVNYKKIELLPNGDFNYAAVEDELRQNRSVRMIFVQRSRGYTQRPTLSLEKMEPFFAFVKKLTDAVIMVDNCYGEFAAEKEPTQIGADLIAGSLIKNPGGGLAQTGGYIAGRKDLIEKCAYRLTAVGIGKECGASLQQLRNMYQGFFMAPHTVAQAMKTAVFAAGLFAGAGFEVSPSPSEQREDIIQTITFRRKEPLIAFCKGIQAGAPIDSYVVPEPWAMPGYSDQVIMAAGSFVSGASIELSADAPIKPPYTAYFQGGLTYHSGKLAISKALQILLDETKN